jgi:diaminopimelate epimerase
MPNMFMKDLEWPIPFCKMNGAGNDFVIIDHRTPLIPGERMAEFARLVCRRKFSVGADGLFLIEPSEIADFKWRFFNADGSEAAMCGNGARCVARFAALHGIATTPMRFETLAGIIEATVADTEVTITMTPPHSFRFDQPVEVAGQSLVVHGVDTGVPHIVLFVDQLDTADVVGLGRLLRHHPLFGPSGTNVNFVGRCGQGWGVRTYERGVEDETMACGTGVVAGALIAAAKGRAVSPVAMVTAGGIGLSVQFATGKEDGIEQVQLKGPAQLVYRGQLTAEALLD